MQDYLLQDYRPQDYRHRGQSPIGLSPTGLSPCRTIASSIFAMQDHHLQNYRHAGHRSLHGLIFLWKSKCHGSLLLLSIKLNDYEIFRRILCNACDLLANVKKEEEKRICGGRARPGGGSESKVDQVDEVMVTGDTLTSCTLNVQPITFHNQS